MFARAMSTWGRLLGLGSKNDPEEERRRHGRFHCDLETTCHPAGRDPFVAVPARVKNVSRSGACLLVPRAFRTGELISLSLPNSTTESNTEILACVVRCDPADEQRWEVGCNFSSILADADLHRFHSPANTSKELATEERNWKRFECQAQAVYQLVSEEEPTSPWNSAEILNISGGGIALKVRQELAVGDLLSIELRRDGMASIAALASVVRTTVESHGEHHVGCTFIHELPEEQLERLLG